MEILVKIENSFKIKALVEMRQTGYRRFFTKIDEIFNNLKLNKLSDAYNVVKMTSNVKNIQEKTDKICQKYLKKHSFDKISARACRVAHYRVGIKLLSYAQEQKAKKSSQDVIKSFRRLSLKAQSLRNISNMLSKK